MTIGEIKTQVLKVLQQNGANTALEGLIDVAFNQAKLDACLKHDFVKTSKTVYVAVKLGQRFKISDLPFVLGENTTDTTLFPGAKSFVGEIYGDGSSTFAYLDLSNIKPVELFNDLSLQSGRLFTTGDYDFDVSEALSQTIERRLDTNFLRLQFSQDTSIALADCVWYNYAPVELPAPTIVPLARPTLRYKSLKFASVRATNRDGSGTTWCPILFLHNVEYYAKQYAASRVGYDYNYTGNNSRNDLVLLHEGDEYWLHSDLGASDSVFELRLNVQEFLPEYTSDDDEDFFTTYGHTYLFWSAVIVGNAMVGVFLPRQEGALDVPTQQLKDSWDALLDWDNALVQSPVQEML